MDQALLDEFFTECGLADRFRVEVGFKGESTSQILDFRQPFLVIGRRAGSDLMLDHWLVSRRHAYLQLIEGRFFCVDLGSRTGTHGGDATERSGWLEPGRAIQIGPYSVRPELPPILDRDYPPLPIVTWTITSPIEEPSFWTMNRGLALIGRSPACRVRLPEADVSRFHCSLVLTTSGVWAIDLLSQRPVIVNGQPVRFARIAPGDELQIGRYFLTPEYDLSLIKAAGSRPDHSASSFEPRSVASTVRPDPATDHLPALKPSVTVPGMTWDQPGTFKLADNGAFQSADPTVNHLMQHFGAMHQQLVDQTHQTMMMMYEAFAALHRETSASIREEFEEVRKLSSEIEDLRKETARLAEQTERVAEATTMSLQEPAFARVLASLPNSDPNHPQNGHSLSPESPAKPEPRTRPKMVPPLPDPHVDIHAQLCQRLNLIESERQTRWQKIMAMMATRS